MPWAQARELGKVGLKLKLVRNSVGRPNGSSKKKEKREEKKWAGKVVCSN